MIGADMDEVDEEEEDAADEDWPVVLPAAAAMLPGAEAVTEVAAVLAAAAVALLGAEGGLGDGGEEVEEGTDNG